MTAEQHSGGVELSWLTERSCLVSFLVLVLYDLCFSCCNAKNMADEALQQCRNRSREAGMVTIYWGTLSIEPYQLSIRERKGSLIEYSQ
jgi:hypothetical protein